MADKKEKTAAPKKAAKTGAEKVTAKTTEKVVVTVEVEENTQPEKVVVASYAQRLNALKSRALIYGDKEIGEVVDLIVSFVGAYQAAKADGTINQNDFAFLIDPLTKILPAFQGASLISKEWKDFDEDEKAEQFAKFGRVIRNPRILRAFIALVNLGDAITELAGERNDTDEVEA